MDLVLENNPGHILLIKIVTQPLMQSYSSLPLRPYAIRDDFSSYDCLFFVVAKFGSISLGILVSRIDYR